MAMAFSLLLFFLLENWSKFWIDHWLWFLVIINWSLNLVIFLQKVFVSFLHKFLNLWLWNHFINHLLLKLVKMTLAAHGQLVVMGLTHRSCWLFQVWDFRIFERVHWTFVLQLYLIFSICTESGLVKLRRFLNWLMVLWLTHLDENVLLYFSYVNFVAPAIFIFNDAGFYWQLSWCHELMVVIVVVYVFKRLILTSKLLIEILRSKLLISIGLSKQWHFVI